MRLIYITTVAFISTLLISCGGKNEQITTGDASTNSEQQTYTDADLDRDSHTLSNYREVKVEHSHLNLEVDFDEEKLKGSVVHSIQNMSGVKEVVFDTKNLEIKNVMVDGAKASYRMGSADELLGVPLIVEIQPESKSVEIEYETTEGAEALDWVSPELTAGKGHPYLFTQGQSIFTRTWIPIMDTPGLRITYSADIKVPSHLLAVMSADNPTERNELGEYHFEMTQPVPCYLMALAVGNLEFRAIDSRTGVYSEPEMIDDCAYEFADMGKMVTQAEELYGAYQWGRYDIIVLPPSFPFGGMENPKLTFATPTIIAGDRSLVALVAHELAHSWSGNLVTNSTWNDFWLNEGFTVYFERRIMEGIYGKDYADMLAILGYQDLRRSLDELPSDEQRLKLALKRRHPDVGMTDIAYEKGCFFLKMLEEAVGRAKFDTFLNQYFEEHKFETITTEQFVDYLNDHLLDSAEKKINVAEWIYEPGIPANCPVVVSANFNNVEEQLNAFYAQNDVNSVI
ncbi:MAG TPA: aminopeptidase, partial [Flavobacteriales bacterium]|nr:aminopeptidase [Flavobacteriales bacterium]